MPFRYRIRWRFEHGHSISGLKAPVTVSPGNASGDFELRPIEEADQFAGQGIALRSSEFATADGARAEGERALLRLLHASIENGYGVSLKPRIPPGFITEYGKKALGGDRFDVILDDEFGLCVYEEKGRTAFANVGTPQLLTSQPIDRFIESWQRANVQVTTPSGRLLTSYDLYANARFENSSRARFLLLVMSIESLVEQTPRTVAEQLAVDAAISAVQASGLSADEVGALTSGIAMLKNNSIAHSTKLYLTRAHEAGVLSVPESSLQFAKAYNIRSKLVHRGITPAPSDLADRAAELERIAKELLLAIIEARWV